MVFDCRDPDAMKEAGYTAIAALIHFDCTAAGAAVLAELRPRPDQIERIDIATYRFASVMRNPDPPNYFASKYSLSHAAAVMVIRGNAGFAELDDSALNDPAIAALRHRVHVTEDPAMRAISAAADVMMLDVAIDLFGTEDTTKGILNSAKAIQAGVQPSPLTFLGR
jgi:2-methylcitrate dehydratase PrpD